MVSYTLSLMLPKIERYRSDKIAEATRLLRSVESSDPDLRAGIYRRVANLLIDLRETYTTPDGAPDWRGTSYDYRKTVAEIYSGARLPASEPRHPTKSALRYHIGVALRERLSPDDLESAGLHAQSQRDSQRIRYRESGALADNAHTLLVALGRHPNKKPTSEDIAVAFAVVDRLTDWLTAQGVARSQS